MTHLRLTRVGKKNRPLYRLVVVPKHRDPWSPALEVLGTLDPRTKKRELNTERIKYWLSVGAQASKTVHNLLVTEKVVDAKKKSVTHLSGKRRKAMAEASGEKKTD